MPHPIYGPPEHALESVSTRLLLPTMRNDRRGQLTVTGESSTKRGSLWSYSESWEGLAGPQALAPVDTLHWLLLAAWQDRPSSQGELKRSLRPGGWVDEQLPL